MSGLKGGRVPRPPHTASMPMLTNSSCTAAISASAVELDKAKGLDLVGAMVM